MSSLGRPGGDDHPDAALKHLEDVGVLLSNGRADGAAYLAGYTVECSLKSLLQVETGQRQTGHDLGTLQQEVVATCTLAGAKTARYIGPSVRGFGTAALASWEPSLRYRSPVVTLIEATRWHREADNFYKSTIGQMLLDGVI